MPKPVIVRAFVALWWTVGIVLLVSSSRAVLEILTAVHSPADMHVLVLASIETIAAMLFLIPRTTRVGGIGLLAILGVAVLLHAGRGEFPPHLWIYAAAVLFVVVHGPVRWWRHGVGEQAQAV